MAFSSSRSLSHLGFSVFSFSQAQPWPSFCFHSHLSPLAMPLIGVTTTSGRGSSSLILYFLSLFFFFFFNFYLPFRQDRTPLTLILFHFLISLMNNILFLFWLAWWMGFLFWISGISNNCYFWHFFGWALKMFVEMLHSVLVYLSVFCLFLLIFYFFFYFYAKTVMLCVWKLNFFLISLINGFSCWV